MVRPLLARLGLGLALVHCGGSGTEGTGGGAGAEGATTGTTGEGGATSSSTSSSTSAGVGGSPGAGGSGEKGTPVRELEGLESITFYERTGGTEPTPYTFAVGGPELMTRLADPLSEVNHDIPGAPTEYYDVYYSDAEGEFELDGEYLTISGVFTPASPAPGAGGLNLAEISLNFQDASPEFGNYVASHRYLGTSALESSAERCIDGDLQTHTTMGDTVGSTERLRLTLGFASSSGPPPK